MSAQNSKDNSNLANEEKARNQRLKILKEIKSAEVQGKFTITFREEMWPSNKTYLQENGYTVVNHGGPQNTFYHNINW